MIACLFVDGVHACLIDLLFDCMNVCMYVRMGVCDVVLRAVVVACVFLCFQLPQEFMITGELRYAQMKGNNLDRANQCSDSQIWLSCALAFLRFCMIFRASSFSEAMGFITAQNIEKLKRILRKFLF